MAIFNINERPGDFLSDNFFVSGTDFNEFKEMVKAVSDTIKYWKVKSDDLPLLSHLGTTDDGEVDYFFTVDPESLDILPNIIGDALQAGGVHLEGYDGETKKLNRVFSKSITNLPKTVLQKKGNFDSLLKEMREVNHLMLHLDYRKSLFTSRALFSTLDRFGLKGTFLLKPSLTRDFIVLRALTEQEKKVTVIGREVNGVGKAFSILSGRYAPIDQSVIFDIIKKIEDRGELGKAQCRSWEISHFVTRIFLEFPDKAAEITDFYGKSQRFIPGICISTSDTGDCSLKVRGTFRFGSSVTTHKEVLHKHTSSINLDEFLDEVENTIFADFTKLPTRLCELMSIDITDGLLDLSTEAGRLANSEAYKEAMTGAFKELNIVKAVGNKVKTTLLNCLCEEANPSIHYTAYDICIELMRLPERVGSIPSLEPLQNAVGKAPYVKYESLLLTVTA